MSFNQKEYTKKYQKDNYKMYQFRVKKSNKDLIKKIDSIKNKNEFFISLLDENFKSNKDIYTLSKIKEIIKPILAEFGIYEVYLFGSYARGEANKDSDIDIYCEDGNLKSLFDEVDLENKLKDGLGKPVDVVYMNSTMPKTFKENLEKDLIKLC